MPSFDVFGQVLAAGYESSDTLVPAYDNAAEEDIPCHHKGRAISEPVAHCMNRQAFAACSENLPTPREPPASSELLPGSGQT